MKIAATQKTGRCVVLALLWVATVISLNAQVQGKQKHILVDVSHGQRFWNDPVAMAGKDSNQVARIHYMHGELVKNATTLKADVSYLKGKITPAVLSTCNVLFIHIPASKYDTDEVKAIQQYLQRGGSLFLVMDSDYWSTLVQTNVNDIINPFTIQFGSESPIAQAGGHASAGVIVKKDLSISYHGARIVTGGTPFCFSNQTDEYPFGTYKMLKNGGKIIVMGDGMVSLYMTSWEGVNNYQCSEFMHDVLGWLLK